MTDTSIPEQNGAVLAPGSSAALVSGAEVGRHLSCDYVYVRKLVAEGLLLKHEGGFNLDDCRRKYIAFLRAERRKTPRSESAAEFTRSKTELMQLRIAKE